ncbi:MAG: 50S ribosomal protein L17 [Bacteroidetes bacterium]|nr:50S ribosomal protein L17 [Bacteroidota bacterium]MBP8753911.1 50S ribosomal protein L17 [Chitinophagales bacterium]MBK7107814.1 50S ribosomal protein L17 [Bacteroidota bacterium]MBK8486749.1 50S ribosomal protein L17 [Bacteroidota bacterium]MBP9188937.1 50S ribosomal protein L17 [Chitinophagales bacterium]
MRHGNKINHLGRTYSHRKAMLMNMGTSLLMHKRIQTTLAKAKELRVYIEPLMTKAKEDTTHNRRTVFASLRSKEAVTELFNNISVKIATRNGGYTRILKLGDNRAGDNAEMCIIELVDYNEGMLKDSKTATKKRTRRGAATSKTSAPKAVEKKEEIVAEKEEDKAEEAPEVIEEKPSEESTDTTSEEVK